MRARLLPLVGLCLFLCAAACAADEAYDLVVYGATPAGIGAALSLARLTQHKAKILVLEPTGSVHQWQCPFCGCVSLCVSVFCLCVCKGERAGNEEESKGEKEKGSVKARSGRPYHVCACVCV